MNRREAYFEFSKMLINDSKESYVHKTKYKNLIVKIYNDFENRSCKNCKYCKYCAKKGGTCGVCK